MNTKKKSQLSLELLVFLAAYFAFIAVMAGFARENFDKTVSVGKNASAQAELEGACFYIDFFSLDGKNALSRSDFSNFSSSGKTLSLEKWKRGIDCGSEFGFDSGLLKVRVSYNEDWPA